MYEKEEIAKIIENALGYDKELYEEFRELKSKVYHAYGEELEGEVLDVIKGKLVDYVYEVYVGAVESVEKHGVNETELASKNLDTEFFRKVRYWKWTLRPAILNFIWTVKRYIPRDIENFILEPEDEYIVYGDTMGFIKPAGKDKWEVFEESDEPTALDLYLYRKLVLGGQPAGKITLYGMHGQEFVDKWESEGIPPDVYFSTERWIAKRYWHYGVDDVLIRVVLPEDAVIPTADKEYKTIRLIKPGEFSIKILS
jgi:hypothetical protein